MGREIVYEFEGYPCRNIVLSGKREGDTSKTDEHGAKFRFSFLTLGGLIHQDWQMESPNLNPYEAPSSQQLPPALPSSDNSFRKMGAFAWIAAISIGLTLPYSAFVCLLMLQIVVLPMEVVEMIDGLHGLNFFIGVIFYCMWKYRCACNARHFYGGPLLYTPGWCVGYYFIPIMMLFRPYQCMKDIFEKTYLVIEKKPPIGLVLVWWFSWIFSGIVGRIAMKSEDITMISIMLALSSLSALLVLCVIFTLTRRQYEIIEDASLAAKIGSVNPFYKSLPEHIPAIPMKRAQLPEKRSTENSTSE